MGPREKAKSWQTEGDLAQNCRERKSNFRFQFVEWGNGGCSRPCGMAKKECPALYPPRVMAIIELILHCWLKTKQGQYMKDVVGG